MNLHFWNNQGSTSSTCGIFGAIVPDLGSLRDFGGSTTVMLVVLDAEVVPAFPSESQVKAVKLEERAMKLKNHQHNLMLKRELNQPDKHIVPRRGHQKSGARISYR